MKRKVGTVVALWLLAACGDRVEGRSDEELAAAPADRIEEDVDWVAPEGWEGIGFQQPGSPHGPWVAIRANPVAARNLGGPQPPGAILTKRHFDDEAGTQPQDIVFAMWKLADFDEAQNGWFFARWDDGELGPHGSTDACWACHSSGADAVRSAERGPGNPPDW